MALSYANGSIYSLGYYGSSNFLTALPLPSATLTMPNTTPKAYDATIVGTNCASSTLLRVQMYSMGSKIVIACSPSTGYTKIIVFDPSGAGAYTTYTEVYGAISSPVSIVPVANINGQAPFIFYADKLGGVASISLGSTVPTYQNTSKVVSVAGSFGVNPSPSSRPAPTPSYAPSGSGSSSSSSSSTGLIIGIIVALIVIGLVIFFVLRKRRNKADAVQAATTAAAGPKPAMTSSGPKPPTANQAAVTYEQHQQHFRPALAQAQAIAPIVPAGHPAYSQPQPQPQPQPHSYYQPQPSQLAYQQPGGYPYVQPQSQPAFAPPGSNPYATASTQPPVQSVQAELLQQFNFSSHPRPSVVTTVKPMEAKVSDSLDAPLPPVPNVWEPRPFVPPVKNPSPLMRNPEVRPSAPEPSVDNATSSAAASQGYATGYGYGSSPAGGSGSYGSSYGGGGISGSVTGTALPEYTFTNPTNSSYGSPHTDPASPPVPNHSRPV
ncbi:hypothetical protein EMPS_04016 [Entomortierella parvispora]|uniref:Transmembrane protein n=1 Tax=Entomortierella parvispora TaxID=205924 RepID=A0A9P3LUZ7_9FUNG|nr:hypothetical protein EMPS_04016 [Entomortierella parvispora]